MDLINRHTFIENNILEFVIVSKDNICYQFILEHHKKTQMILNVSVSLWNDEKYEVAEQTDPYNNISQEEKQKLNNNVNDIIEEVSESYDLHITSKPEEILTNMK